MNKKLIVLGLVIFSMAISTNFKENNIKALTSDNIISPRLECTVTKSLVDKDNLMLKAIDAVIIQQDNNLNITIKNRSSSIDGGGEGMDDEGDDNNTTDDLEDGIDGGDEEPDEQKDLDIGSDEKVFVVISDRLKLRGNKKIFLNETNGKFQNSVKLPFFYDMVYLDFYKQKKTDPDFTIKEENFIGRTKITMRNTTAYYREGQKIEINDHKGSKKSHIYMRYLPNFYRIDVKTNETANNTITKIVLPESQKDAMSEKDKVDSAEYVKINYPDDQHDSRAFYSTFYLPNTISEFSLLVYEEEITDEEDDIVNKYDVKLVKN